MSLAVPTIDGADPAGKLLVRSDMVEAQTFFKFNELGIKGGASSTMTFSDGNVITWTTTTVVVSHKITAVNLTSARSQLYWVMNNHATIPLIMAHDTSANMYMNSDTDRVLLPGETACFRVRNFGGTKRLEEVGAKSTQLITLTSGGYKSLSDTKFHWTRQQHAPYESFAYNATFVDDDTMPQPYYYVHPVFIPTNNYFTVTKCSVT